ncbi:MAG: peptide chain release factor N(5)-glutamine methyltransferase [Gemmatimonadales bacterium]
MPEVALALGVLIDGGAEHLRRSSLADARREALRIWTELADGCITDALLSREVGVGPVVAQRYRQAIVRRAGGEPLAHVTGQAGFRHLTLRSDSRALIPRPETEGLVDLLLERIPAGRVADIGTGSGCIALSLALEGRYDDVIAVDSSPDALALARVNCELQGVRVNLVRADLCSALRPASIDALVSNPPYLTRAEYAGLDRSVRDWEPEAALVSGEDGLEATARLLEEGPGVLRPGGWLAIEIDCGRAVAAARRAAQLGWQDVSVHRDLFGRERYLLARRSNAL